MIPSDEKWMKEALTLACEGWGKTNPNPLVGCVIVKNGHKIATGYHAAWGADHAERMAIKQAQKKCVSLTGATLYVNLEPCVHQGRTPPCTDLILETGISSVVIAMTDPNPIMSGKGIEKLKRAQISVTCGVLASEAEKLNEIFIKYITTRRPFILLKTAISLDGKIATRTGQSRWISGEQSRALVHQWRRRVAGIMAGTNTIQMDDPELTARTDDKSNQNPTRIIVDRCGRLPIESKVFQKAGRDDVLLATTSQMPASRQKAFENAGIKVICLEDKNRQVDLKALVSYLGEKGLDSVLLEGGGKLNEAFLRAGLIDKLMLFMAPKIIGGRTSPSLFNGEGIDSMSEVVRLTSMSVSACGDDWLIEAYPQRECD